MAGKDRYNKEWHEFADMLKTGARPDTFEAAWALVPRKISGMYEAEMRALWTILEQERVWTIAEIGRNLGGTLFMFFCCCRGLDRVYSVDNKDYEVSDEALIELFDRYGVGLCIDTRDSATATVPMGETFDFVFIDGLHTGAGVRADIEIWKDHARLIGFHDYSNNKTNKHKRHYPDVVYEISKAARDYGWVQVGERGRSEIVYRTENY